MLGWFWIATRLKAACLPAGLPGSRQNDRKAMASCEVSQQELPFIKGSYRRNVEALPVLYTEVDTCYRATCTCPQTDFAIYFPQTI